MSLSSEEYSRYGRQMQVPVFQGLQGQIKLKTSKVLVVGCGGLGSSALLYLAASGLGTIGLLDHDRVEVSNLHRQIIHDTSTVGMYKTESAARKMNLLNPHLNINLHTECLSSLNSLRIFKDYNLVLDCTDNPITKYLISDTCVVLNIPLVNASSVKTDGQLMVLNFQDGPCYRCINPVPTKPENIATCSDNGVIGPCVGLVGTMMSIETIKILTGFYNSSNPYKPIMMMYSGYMDNNGQMLKSFKMRGKKKDCVCNTMNRAYIQNFNYSLFCGDIQYDVLEDQYRLSFSDLSALDSYTILDVRPTEQFEIANFKDYVNLPLINIPYTSLIRKDLDTLKAELPNHKIICVCKRGNDSRLSAKYLRDIGIDAFDLVGGLDEYAKHNKFNVYW
ncbi:uncharacterized protein C5L36_0C11660 [Pichia kudriavzevii]|uniref:Rhodanese domain-containing protein n=1 Tax=Pichia kudriavzevii TaxID=4909 RepID=A0A2U9R766_PICKU|nr:uncharacterized protein C5L36_0C11660 [Pichia kudriavzevii]AWU77260.1 hypothetical protein C5L36_0C11660 [Pichia kudriavzevii]